MVNHKVDYQYIVYKVIHLLILIIPPSFVVNSTGLLARPTYLAFITFTVRLILVKGQRL